ncbi:uncharacterized protein LOC116211963 [Punica granatum]|uniref:Uncharacterized protein LOC116211963 n=2 Tax=Punica granatum TaxID=22663 RepID=A0A6P8E4H1_PUNGR|nr:uncharacterized protein LOC116211963 [Punica granatum]XP_031402376.1 uncharacterized protein LOC116211963 [Punica granatum]XP_031402377.1 uncharacterized protein LOC116211963 [Punica granatum]PKI40522.1 hypothetical protein CRG98_039082 [Punica granatum]
MLQVAAAVLLAGGFGYVYKSLVPPQPKVCGSPGGPPVTSPRIKLSDGRHLAYRERGVPRDKAKHKVILVHGFDSSKDLYIPLSQELMEELDLCVIAFDRAGYGESDPYPKRSVKSEAFDIQELADELKLGPKFYLMGVSIGTFAVWSCIRHIPHRLAGVALIVPVINFWWLSFPPKLVNEAFKQQLKRDQWKLWIAHHTPGLLYWWMTQRMFPYSSIMQRHPILLNERDLKTIQAMSKIPNPGEHKIRHQGEYESLYRDMMIHFGKWEFDPMELRSPFPNNEGSVYLWQGHNDKLVPFELQRFVAQKLPWIKYHEVSDGGHLMIHENALCEAMFRELLFGEEPSF